MFLRLVIASLLFLCFAASHASADERMIGREPEGDWSSFVAFSDKGTDLYNRCNGTLVHPRFVLTTGFGCMLDRRDDAWAYVGATSDRPYNGEKIAIDQVYTHPRFNTEQAWWSIVPTWNALLVRLAKPAKAKPATLGKDRPTLGSYLDMVGLGNSRKVGEEGDYFRILQSRVKVVPQRVCASLLPGHGLFHSSFLCAADEEEGPCILNDGTGVFQNGLLVGSFNLLWGKQGQPLCPGKDTAGIYTPINSTKDWIKKVTRKGYDRGNLITFGATVFSKGEMNVHVWANQEVSPPRVRFKDRVCLKKSRCLKKGKWLRLQGQIPGSKNSKSNYWITYDMIWDKQEKKKCLRGEIEVVFRYPGRKEKRRAPFRGCRRGNESIEVLWDTSTSSKKTPFFRAHLQRP